ncbi:MAG: hypothetical protein KA440_03045 [Azonexus sp.]|nr:hypothetical protein [Azonexus sp.]
MLRRNDGLIVLDRPSAAVNFTDYTEQTRYIPSPLRLYLNTVYKYSTFPMATWQENSAFKSRLRRVLLALGLAVMAAQSFAKPAAWYRWASKMTDHRVCAQTSPGPGWFREPIAFTDSGCSIRVKPF